MLHQEPYESATSSGHNPPRSGVVAFFDFNVSLSWLSNRIGNEPSAQCPVTVTMGRMLSGVIGAAFFGLLVSALAGCLLVRQQQGAQEPSPLVWNPSTSTRESHSPDTTVSSDNAPRGDVVLPLQ